MRGNWFNTTNHTFIGPCKATDTKKTRSSRPFVKTATHLQCCRVQAIKSAHQGLSGKGDTMGGIIDSHSFNIAKRDASGGFGELLAVWSAELFRPPVRILCSIYSNSRSPMCSQCERIILRSFFCSSILRLNSAMFPSISRRLTEFCLAAASWRTTDSASNSRRHSKGKVGNMSLQTFTHIWTCLNTLPLKSKCFFRSLTRVLSSICLALIFFGFRANTLARFAFSRRNFASSSPSAKNISIALQCARSCSIDPP